LQKTKTDFIMEEVLKGEL